VEKNDKTWPCKHFVEHLEEEFDVGNVCGLLEDYEKLAMLTNAVIIQSYNLKDDS